MGCSALLWGLLRAHPRARYLAGVSAVQAEEKQAARDLVTPPAGSSKPLRLAGREASRQGTACLLSLLLTRKVQGGDAG